MKISFRSNSKFLTGFVLYLLFSQYFEANAQKPFTPIHESFTRTINTILDDSIYRSSFIGIKIIAVHDDRILYERNSNKLFHPASNLKLFTTAAAIHFLPINFLFTTSISSDGRIVDSVLRGNLYIRGHGDPLLATSDFDSLAQVLWRQGIRSITGNLIGDVSYFDTLSWGHGWMWDDEPQADEPFLSPLSVNGNAVLLHVNAGAKLGDTLSYILEPQTSLVTITNHAITTDDTTIEKVHAIRPHQSNVITIEGGLPPGSTYDLGVSVANPAKIFVKLFKERLDLAGIRIKGSSLIGNTSGKNLITTYSHPLDSIIFRSNRLSDNLAAEHLLKTIAAEKNGMPGSSSSGIDLVRQYLHTIGIDTTTMQIVDGSGISWYNELTPNAIVRLLRYEALHKKTFSRFYESLAIAGYEGTIRNRMVSTKAAGNVHAKTGTLTGVSCISGYVTSTDNKLCAFSILCNHFPGEMRSLRTMQDSILEFIANSSVGK